MDNIFIVKNLEWESASIKQKIIVKIVKIFGMNIPNAQPKYSGMLSTLEKRMNMSMLIDQVLAYNIAGDVVEVGCNDGKSACLFQTYLQYYDTKKSLHLYDSFVGLPAPNYKDEFNYSAGDLATSIKQLLGNFHSLGLDVPNVHPGWFKDTLPKMLPNKICFAHLDGDFYESILESLVHVYPRLTKGAICLIDDYADPVLHKTSDKFPGVKKACDKFFENKNESVSLLYAGHYSHGYFRKK